MLPPPPLLNTLTLKLLNFNWHGTAHFWGNVINTKRQVRETLVKWYKPTFAFVLIMILGLHNKGVLKARVIKEVNKPDSEFCFSH